jgi:hypothetical protein
MVMMAVWLSNRLIKRDMYITQITALTDLLLTTLITSLALRLLHELNSQRVSVVSSPPLFLWATGACHSRTHRNVVALMGRLPRSGP